MRLLIFHGYLLAGTGSNVYNAQLAQALVGAGHEVHLLCQDRHALRYPFVDRVGRWEGGALRFEGRKEGARCTVYLPPIGSLLPVFVLDRYAHFQAKTFLECHPQELGRYLEANVAAVAEVTELAAPEGALANHLLLGPAILRRALPAAVPYAVKVHGSDLEYALRPDPERFLPPVREGLAGATAVLVGSSDLGQRTAELVGDQAVAEKLRLAPPGVDTARFKPLPRQAAARPRTYAALLRTVREEGEGGGPFAPDRALAEEALGGLDPEREPLFAFVGKLIPQKGPDLALGAAALLFGRAPQARFLFVGAGPLLGVLRELASRLGAGRFGEAAALASEHGLADLARYLAAQQRQGGDLFRAGARLVPARVGFSGPLDHRQLPLLLALCEAVVVPSRTAEAFGMIAAEAAAAAALPVVADHSGLAEVAALLGEALPERVRHLLSFPLGEGAVEEVSQRLLAWLYAPLALRSQVRRTLSRQVRERLGWPSVAERLVRLLAGEREAFPRPLLDGVGPLR